MNPKEAQALIKPEVEINLEALRNSAAFEVARAVTNAKGFAKSADLAHVDALAPLRLLYLLGLIKEAGYHRVCDSVNAVFQANVDSLVLMKRNGATVDGFDRPRGAL